MAARGRPPTPEATRRLIRDMLLEGDRPQQVADAAGVSVDVVYRVAKRFSIDLRACRGQESPTRLTGGRWVARRGGIRVWVPNP